MYTFMQYFLFVQKRAKYTTEMKEREKSKAAVALADRSVDTIAEDQKNMLVVKPRGAGLRKLHKE